ncbi:OmpL47-type beta-barrel domain-containing protein [Intrasporangium sp. YIM S08009]|uniref:OmpL47-type beta-barrel domain-containing protein n=1 Tax=Intrasporangium zincisolvens TaxID=3080018 RepID=UPI002B052EB0|nr:hypothetical protein [Intrasporangium sp. YIM S08009]
MTRLRAISTARRLVLAGALALGLTAVGSSAWAYWNAVGAGSGQAKVATMSAPTNVAATANAGSVSLTWTAASLSTGAPASGYYATRSDGRATTCGTPSAPVTTTTCTDSGVSDGTYSYTVTAVHRTWTATSTSSNSVLVDTAAPSVSAVVSPTPNGAGYNTTTPVTVTLTATDSAGGSGVASVTWWVGAGTPTTVTGSSASVSLSSQETNVVSYFATDRAGNASTTKTTTVRIDTVAPSVSVVSVPSAINAANMASTSASGTVEAGASVTVVATDGTRSTAPVTAAVTGTSWSASGIAVTALRDGSITYTATATDAAGNSAPASRSTTKSTIRFVLTMPSSAVAGTAFTATLTATSSDGSTATGYSGTKTVAFTGPSTSLDKPTTSDTLTPLYPASVTFANGVGTASITLKRAETAALTATEGSGPQVVGSSSITVSAGPATHLAWSTNASTGVGAPGCLFACTVTGFGNNNTLLVKVSVTDNWGNTVNNYTGNATVTLSFVKDTTGGSLTPLSLTLPSSGPAQTTSGSTYKGGTGQGWTDRITATSGSLASATASLSK